MNEPSVASFPAIEKFDSEKTLTPSLAVFDAKLDRQRVTRSRPIIATTDIDGSWEKILKKGDQIEKRNQEFRDATLQTKTFLDSNNIPLVALTGRPIDLVETDSYLFTGGSFHFDAVFCAVGTELYVPIVKSDGKIGFALDPEWKNHMEKDIGFKRNDIYPQCLAINKAVLDSLPESQLIFQERDREENVAAWAAEKGTTPPGKPEPYKISYRFRAKDIQEMERLREIYRKGLNKKGLDKLKIVISHGSNLEGGVVEYNMDLVPVTKQDSLQYLRDRYMTQHPQEQPPLMAYAGDSGNDEDPLSASDIGIIVGGEKQKDLKKLTERTPRLKRTSHFLTYQDGASKSTKLLFIEPTIQKEDGPDSFKNEGPESIRKARRALRLLEALQKKSSEK